MNASAGRLSGFRLQTHTGKTRSEVNPGPVGLGEKEERREAIISQAKPAGTGATVSMNRGSHYQQEPPPWVKGELLRQRQPHGETRHGVGGASALPVLSEDMQGGVTSDSVIAWGVSVPFPKMATPSSVHALRGHQEKTG